MNPGPLSRKRKLGYHRLFAQLRKRKSPADDSFIESVHDSVFASTDCINCANCCKTHPPLIISKDVGRISKFLRIRQAEFVSKYLILDEDGDWIINSTPCTFLGADNRCSIYEVRPNACREYPHTNRKKLYQIENITMKNAEICPAVVTILDNIEKEIKKL